MTGAVPVSEASKLTAHLQRMKAHSGFVLSHVSVPRTSGMTVERVCREVHRMLDAWEQGYLTLLDFKDGYGARV